MLEYFLGEWSSRQNSKFYKEDQRYNFTAFWLAIINKKSATD